MRLVIAIIIIIAGVVLTLVFLAAPRENANQSPKPSQNTNFTNAGTMTITSPVFNHNGFIPKKYTCDGEDINPPLEISGVPVNAKSLVLVVDDPDAPGKTWVHWTLWNINPQTTRIDENSVPAGAVGGVTDFGKPGYGGPCPPSGTHRYFFKIYALDTILNLPASTRKSDLERAMQKHILDQAELIGLYKR